jgi:hypothetical protein
MLVWDTFCIPARKKLECRVSIVSLLAKQRLEDGICGRLGTVTAHIFKILRAANSALVSDIITMINRRL